MVSLLSGCDFVTKEFREDIVEESYGKLDAFIDTFHRSSGGMTHER